MLPEPVALEALLPPEPGQVPGVQALPAAALEAQLAPVQSYRQEQIN